MHRVRLGPRTRRLNGIAVAVTVGAMGAAFALAPGVAAPILAWAVGHAAWGAFLASRVVRGRVGE